MKVIRAETMGMCHGVRRALAIARAIDRPREVTINGALVHNRTVSEEMTRLGFRRVESGAAVESILSRTVLVTAHGISAAATRRLEAAGLALIDATCPLVKHAQAAAEELRAAGRFLVIIGRRDHTEVRGITEDCPGVKTFAVVETIEDVHCFGRPLIGVICQTTTTPGRAAALLDAIRRRNPTSDIRFIDTVCHATRTRQNAVAALLPRVDLLVVVGGRDSENTRRLVEIAAAHRKPVLHIEEAGEIDPHRLLGAHAVGLTAGASTPDEVIEAVHLRLVEIEILPRPVQRSRARSGQQRPGTIGSAGSLPEFGVIPS